MKNKILLIAMLFLSILWVNNTLSQCVSWLDTGGPDNTEVFTYGAGSIVNIGCGDLSSANYDMSIRTCDFYETGDFANATIEFDLNNTLGWDSERFSQDQCTYAYVVSQTATTLHLRTFVFHLDNHYTWFWRPCEPQQSHIRYRICKTIPQIVFKSNMPIDNSTGNYILTKNSYGDVYPENRTNVNCYQWCLLKCSNPNCLQLPWDEHGVKSLTPNNMYYFRIYNYNFDGSGCDGDLIAPQGFTISEKLTMGNTGGCMQQTSTSIPIQFSSTQIGGCPWLWVQNDSQLVPENNVFYKSEFSEFYGNDITDLYLLQNKPMIDSNGNINIQFTESVNDITYFDQLKLNAVDHPVGTKVGITENGDIVLYYSDDVSSPDNATLNEGNNITENIQYNYNGEKIVKGVNTDSVYAHFDSTAQQKIKKLLKNKKLRNGSGTQIDSLALLGRLGHNPDNDYVRYPAVKDWAGTIGVFFGDNTSTELQFARREQASDILIPVGNLDDEVVYTTVEFDNDYEMTYFTVVPVMYYGYTKTSLQIESAEHSNEGDISTLIGSVDQNYAYLDSTCVISLKYQDISGPSEGYIRDYVFESNGHYILPGLDNRLNTRFNNPLRKTNNTDPVAFELFNNYPNPFNPVTSIKYSIPKDDFVTLKIYDLKGELITTLVNENQIKGEYEVNFNAKKYASGVYFYVLESGQFIKSKKMVLIK